MAGRVWGADVDDEGPRAIGAAGQAYLDQALPTPGDAGGTAPAALGGLDLHPGGALVQDLHAHPGRAAELQGGVDPGVAAQQKALAVVIGDARKHQAERTFPRHRPGRVARQHVDLARLQRGKPRGGIERRERHFCRVAEDRRRHGAANIHVKAGPCILVVHAGEAKQSLADTAIERAALLDGFQGLRTGRIVPGDDQGQ